MPTRTGRDEAFWKTADGQTDRQTESMIAYKDGMTKPTYRHVDESTDNKDR